MKSFHKTAFFWGFEFSEPRFLFSFFWCVIFMLVMAIRQRYGIAFPITIKSGDGSLFDTSDDLVGCVTSEMMHVLFTPKGQKLRDPEFGTELIQYIFNPNDSQTWSDVKHEIKSTVSRYVPDCTVKDVEIAESDDGRELYARIAYSVKQDGTYGEYQIITKL